MQINIQARFTLIARTRCLMIIKCVCTKEQFWFKTNKFIEYVSETILPRLRHDVMKAERPLCPSF